MTITTRPESPRQGAALVDPRPASPSEVWDLGRSAKAGCRPGSVRTLAPSDRTLLRPEIGGGAAPGEVASKFEQPEKREHRDNLALGLMMSAALIIGSIFGGAFAESDGASAGAAAQATAAVDYAR